MNEWSQLLILLSGSFIAGLIGALTGLGGGFIVVPLLTLGLGVPMKYAVAASLISVIGTSNGAAAAYLKEKITNMQVGMFLQIPTTLGAILGAVVVIWFAIPVDILGMIFGIILIITAILTAQKKTDHRLPIVPRSLSDKLQLHGTFVQQKETISYGSVNPILGSVIMGIAGFLSGLLGIGGGVFKVLAMDNVMKLPFKVSTTTSNFMIGVTAVSSAIIYFLNGFVLPQIAVPVYVGIVLGALLGSKILVKIRVDLLKKIFSVVVMIIAVFMIYNALNGNFSK